MTSWPEKVFSFLGLGQYKASPVAAADGAAVPLLVDAYGKQRVIAEISGAATYSHYKHPTGSSNKGVVKAGPGSLRYVQASNKHGTGCWLQLINKASEPSGEGDTSLLVFPAWIPAGETRAVELPTDLAFSTGIAWAASSSATDVTLVAENRLWINALYL